MDKNIPAFIAKLNSRRFEALSHFDEVIASARKDGVTWRNEDEIEDAVLDAIQAIAQLAEAVTELHRKNSPTEQAAD